MKSVGALQTMLAWAEDRALLRSTPSAGPGAKTGDRAETVCSALRSCTSANDGSGIGTNATNLRGTMPRFPGRGCPAFLTYASRREFQFTVNQDRTFQFQLR